MLVKSFYVAKSLLNFSWNVQLGVDFAYILCILLYALIVIYVF